MEIDFTFGTGELRSNPISRVWTWSLSIHIWTTNRGTWDICKHFYFHNLTSDKESLSQTTPSYTARMCAYAYISCIRLSYSNSICVIWILGYRVAEDIDKLDRMNRKYMHYKDSELGMSINIQLKAINHGIFECHFTEIDIILDPRATRVIKYAINLRHSPLSHSSIQLAL